MASGAAALPHSPTSPKKGDPTIRDGKGTYRWPNGKVEMEGEYREGLFYATGIQDYENGAQYVGGFKNHWKHGKGVMKGANGNEYDGEYVDDKVE